MPPKSPSPPAASTAEARRPLVDPPPSGASTMGRVSPNISVSRVFSIGNPPPVGMIADMKHEDMFFKLSRDRPAFEENLVLEQKKSATGEQSRLTRAAPSGIDWEHDGFRRRRRHRLRRVRRQRRVSPGAAGRPGGRARAHAARL